MTNIMAGVFIFSLLFLNCVAIDQQGFITSLEDKLEEKICKYVNYATRYLEEFNDKNLSDTELGKFMRYNEIKPNYNEENGRKSKSIKKMSMAMMPLIFHIGASSTWMLITTLLAAKSVAIGLLLLIFKIAVSSAKVASFFTSLKGKHHHESSWTPIEHGHFRSIHDVVPDIDAPFDWHTPHYIPQWINEPPVEEYKTIPSYERSSKIIQYLEPNVDDTVINEDSSSN